MWGATISVCFANNAKEFQSTHPVWGATSWGLSIHAPRVGCDQLGPAPGLDRADFNPRTPCGVRLSRIFADNPVSIDFNPRTPFGVRQRRYFGDCAKLHISIHAPRVGCDDEAPAKDAPSDKFQSTHPVWGATTAVSVFSAINGFQSTHPVWGAT